MVEQEKVHVLVSVKVRTVRPGCRASCARLPLLFLCLPVLDGGARVAELPESPRCAA